MGWWNASENGVSLHMEDTGLIWGDEVADITDELVDISRETFRLDHGREPSQDELVRKVLATQPWVDEIQAVFAREWNRMATPVELEAGIRFATNYLVDEGEITA